MSGALMVHLFESSHQPFCELLRDKDIQFTERPTTPGVIMASGSVVEILYGVAAVSAALGPVAAVLIAWVKSRSSRRVIITTKKNEIVHVIEGMSAEDVERILESTQKLSVFDTTSKDKDRRT